MATSTPNYSFSLPEVGGDTDQWGTQLNANWTLADSTLKTIEDLVVDVTLTGNDYLSISGQAITVGDVDLTADVSGTLPVASGGTGLAALGSANQVLGVNSGGTALEYKTLSTGGTVTSVAVTGSDGIEIDSGSPITSSGTIALGINSTSLSTHLGLGSLATQSSVTESQISDLGSYITASSTNTLTNKSGNISQWTNDSGYLTAETNDLTNVSGTLAIANGGTGATSASAARTALGLGTAATSATGDFEASGAVSTHAALTSSVHGISSFGATLVDDADAAAARTTLGLGTAATTAATDYATSAQGTTADSALQDLVDDTTPQLGGNLDVNGSSIVSVSAGNIAITPDTTGKIVLDGLSWPTADGSADQVLKTDGAGNLSFVDQSGGGGLSDLEHADSITTAETISAGNHRFYVGPVSFSNTVTIAGKLLVFDGLLNTTGTINTTGTLSVR